MSNTKFPGGGLPLADLVDALSAFDADERVVDKRILSISFRGRGGLEITTGEIHDGEAGRGDELLLRRSAAGWKVVEHLKWVS